MQGSAQPPALQGSAQPPCRPPQMQVIPIWRPLPSNPILDAEWTRKPVTGPHHGHKKPRICRESPLSDSNRRPLPYYGRVRVSRAFTDAVTWALNPCKSPQCGVYGRGARFALVLDLVDAEWTRCTPPVRLQSFESRWPQVTAAAVAAIVIPATIRFAIAPILLPRMPSATPTPRLSRFDTAPTSSAAGHATLRHASLGVLIRPGPHGGASRARISSSPRTG